jgi:hypothetical protein
VAVSEHQSHFAFVDVPLMVEQQAALRDVAEARGIIAPGQMSDLFRGRARGVPDLLHEIIDQFLEANARGTRRNHDGWGAGEREEFDADSAR